MELQALLDLIGRIGGAEPPSDAELREGRGHLRSLLTETLAGPDFDLEAGRPIRQAIDEIDQELSARTEHRATQAAEAAALLEGLAAEEEEEGETEEEEGEDEAESPTPPATEARANSPQDLASAVRRATARVQANAEPEPQSDVRVMGMGPAAGAVSNPNLDLDGAADVFHRYNRHVGRQGRQALLRLEFAYPENRQFGMSVEENTRMVNTIASPRAIVAAGGICDPLPADFSHPICGDRGRPIRNALPAFQADRGGLRFAPSATVADLTSAITVWTNENDASESPDPAVKACPRIDCEEEVEVKVDAIVRCLTIGNFQAKFNPEFWRSRLDLLLVAHDQVAEQTLFANMQALATNVTPVAYTGTARTVLLNLDRLVAGIRSRHRLGNDTVMNWIAPIWLREAIRSSLTYQQPGDGIDVFSAADATINRFLADRNVRAVWSPDLQTFGAQGAGAIVDFAATATTILYPEGTFLFLDGGTLDLGIEVSDTTTMSTNDRQAFAETFEAVAFRGCEALEVAFPISDDCICSDQAS